MKKEVCKNCTHYNAYYHQRCYGYEKQNYGVCQVNKEQRKQNDACEKFYYDELRAKRLKASLYFSLESAARSISNIIHIIKEKEETEKTLKQED